MKTTKAEQHANRVKYTKQRLKQLRDPDLLKSRPYWKYVCNETMIVPCHQEWNGLVLRYDDPWWKNHFPPNGPECRCRVTAVLPEEYTGQIAPLD
jgi:SPP1 gp7 family putative phage head morphogenesis protein